MYDYLVIVNMPDTCHSIILVTTWPKCHQRDICDAFLGLMVISLQLFYGPKTPHVLLPN